MSLNGLKHDGPVKNQTRQGSNEKSYRNAILHANYLIKGRSNYPSKSTQAVLTQEVANHVNIFRGGLRHVPFEVSK